MDLAENFSVPPHFKSGLILYIKIGMVLIEHVMTCIFNCIFLFLFEMVEISLFEDVDNHKSSEIFYQKIPVWRFSAKFDPFV